MGPTASLRLLPADGLRWQDPQASYESSDEASGSTGAGFAVAEEKGYENNDAFTIRMAKL